jgi:hypothetical protein
MVDLTIVPNGIKSKIVKAALSSNHLTDWLNDLENKGIDTISEKDQELLDDMFGLVITD